MFDPIHRILALIHLGWHSTVNNLARLMVEHMTGVYGSSPTDIQVYFSPSIRAASYHFENLQATADSSWHQPPYAVLQPTGGYNIDLVQYNIDAVIRAGVALANIEVSPIDTYDSENYFSYHAHKADKQAIDGRFVVLAQMR